MSCLAVRAERPPCGEDPMLWKERFTRMGGGLKWLGSRPVALFFIVLLACFLMDVSVPALGDLIRGTMRARIWNEMNTAPAHDEQRAGGSGHPADQCGGCLERYLRARAGHLDQPGDDAPVSCWRSFVQSSSARSGALAGSASGSSRSWDAGFFWEPFIRSGCWPRSRSWLLPPG